MRWFKSLLKGLSFSTMATCSVLLAAGVGCGDENFNFCECKYACQASFTDGSGTMQMTAATLTVCDPGDGGYSYGDCGVFCKSTFPATGFLPLETQPLNACTGGPAATICYEPAPGLGPPIVATLSGCMTAPTQTIAKNSCSPGTPVGE